MKDVRMVRNKTYIAEHYTTLGRFSEVPLLVRQRSFRVNIICDLKTVQYGNAIIL